LGEGAPAPVLRPWSHGGRVPTGTGSTDDATVDFESWIRAQLAAVPDLPPSGPQTAARSRSRIQAVGFRAGLVTGAIGIIAVGLLSGKALPVLQLTSPAPHAQELPAETWGGVPAQPRTTQLDAGRGSAGLSNTQGSPGASGRGPSPSGARPEDGGRPAAGGGPVPAAAPAVSPSADDRGGRSPGGSPTPQPLPSATPPDDHGGGSPHPSDGGGRSP
jgi:hypothetical protein